VLFGSPRILFAHLYALLATFVLGSLDEWHQSYIPTRTSSLHDVLLDTCGGFCVQCIIFLAFTLHRIRKSAK
jgi:VanZ family protein